MLSGIKDVLGKSFPIVGGSAADNLRYTKTYQYYNREILNNALIGTILSGEGVFGYGLRHGWHPLGRPHTVTQSSGNIIKEIEGKPAGKRGKMSGRKDLFGCKKCGAHIVIPFGENPKKCGCGEKLTPLLKAYRPKDDIKKLPKPREIRSYVLDQIKDFDAGDLK